MKKIRNLYLFNPDNEMAIASDSVAYMPPTRVAQMVHDLACLPLCFARAEDAVFVPVPMDADFLHQQEQVWGRLPQFVTERQLPDARIKTCRPWGWSPPVCRILAQHTEHRWDAGQKRLYSRLTAREVLSHVCDRLDLPHSLVPTVCTAVAEMEAIDMDVVVKAPWSSAGRGVMTVRRGAWRAAEESWVHGILRRQGYMTVEKWLDKVLDFAVEFRKDESGARFIGYSVFETKASAYVGNKLGDSAMLEAELLPYVAPDELRRIVEVLSDELSQLPYQGYLGVDMMVYRDDDGALRVQPCVEINFRCTMGIVALQLSKRLLAEGCRGVFSVVSYANDGEALAEHRLWRERYPLVLESGKMVSGYFNATPVNEQTRFVARVLICAES